MPPAPPLRSTKGTVVPYDRPVKVKKARTHSSDTADHSDTSKVRIAESADMETKSARKRRRKSKSRSGSALDGPTAATTIDSPSPATQLEPKTKEEIFAAYRPKTPLKATLLANKASTDSLSKHKDRTKLLAISKDGRHDEIDRMKRLERQLAESHEEGKKREEQRRVAEIHLKAKIEQLEQDLESQKEALTAESEKHRDALEAAVLRQKDALRARETVIEDNDKRTEALKEALSCHVCFETLNDPHILHCGHIACRDCLIGWFSTPGAYVHSVPDPIPEDFKLAYRTKLCHVCRSTVTRRPARMYHLQSFLEPLGLDANMPSASQQPIPGSEHDPWRRFFPVLPEQYKIKDEVDNVWRCPECHGEIVDGLCEACDIEFSDDDDYDDFDEEGLLNWDHEGVGTADDPDEDDLDIVVGSSGSEQDEGYESDRSAGRVLRAHARRAARRRPRDIEGDVEMTDEGSDLDGNHHHPDHILNVLDLLAEEDSDAGGSEDREIYQDGEENGSAFDSDIDESQYGGSFIDDGSVEAGSDDESGSRDDEGSEVDGLVEGGDGEVDRPAVEEMRRRRQARFNDK
ncbi:hypothetical protein BCR39DRAFT_536433 [Naematelia encephala]|uniref:RING-type domain-containing protein n=1 Tax=Naematelia encephala TaxID=71784 RepID=A0A1Y2AZR5_9TREE|nr:hypothetical protein BCR39DRAFT_536433 [Naematelia encephala]